LKTSRICVTYSWIIIKCNSVIISRWVIQFALIKYIKQLIDLIISCPSTELYNDLNPEWVTSERLALKTLFFNLKLRELESWLIIDSNRKERIRNGYFSPIDLLDSERCEKCIDFITMCVSANTRYYVVEKMLRSTTLRVVSDRKFNLFGILVLNDCS